MRTDRIAPLNAPVAGFKVIQDLNIGRGEKMLTEKEERIMQTFGAVIPKLPEGDKKYLMGLGDGMALIIKRNELDEKRTINRESTP
jgi:hypothetical protein